MKWVFRILLLILLGNIVWGWLNPDTRTDIPRAPLAPLPYEAVFPSSFRVSFVARLGNLTELVGTGPILFDVDPSGRMYFLHRDRLAFWDAGGGLPASPRRLRGAEQIEGFAWVGGALMMVSGRRLGVLTGEDFKTLLRLPAEGMKLRPAGADRFYLYGGRDGSQERNLYLYVRDHGLVSLVRAPAPILAVAGDGDLTFLAIGARIFLFHPGRPLTPIFETEEEVTSLAMSPPSGLFFSTSRRVGYVHQRLNGYTFLRGKGAELRVQKGSLYLFFRDEGVLRGSPVSDFVRFSRSLDAPGRR